MGSSTPSSEKLLDTSLAHSNESSSTATISQGTVWNVPASENGSTAQPHESPGTTVPRTLDLMQANRNHESLPTGVPHEIGVNVVTSSRDALAQPNGSTGIENIDASGISYKSRSISELSKIEKTHLKNMEKDQLLQTSKKISLLFKDPLMQLKGWPHYFETKEAAGSALQQGFQELWTTFILAETLLAGVAIQPFVTNIPNLSGWQLKVYGGLWAAALLLDFGGLAITALFLGFLLGSPKKLAWVWLCKIGPLIGIPGILVVLDAIWSLIAISFSSWFIYGKIVGIICASLAGFLIIVAMWIANLLREAWEAVQEIE